MLMRWACPLCDTFFKCSIVLQYFLAREMQMQITNHNLPQIWVLLRVPSFLYYILPARFRRAAVQSLCQICSNLAKNNNQMSNSVKRFLLYCDLVRSVSSYSKYTKYPGSPQIHGRFFLTQDCIFKSDGSNLHILTAKFLLCCWSDAVEERNQQILSCAFPYAFSFVFLPSLQYFAL